MNNRPTIAPASFYKEILYIKWGSAKSTYEEVVYNDVTPRYPSTTPLPTIPKVVLLQRNTSTSTCHLHRLEYDSCNDIQMHLFWIDRKISEYIPYYKLWKSTTPALLYYRAAHKAYASFTVRCHAVSTVIWHYKTTLTDTSMFCCSHTHRIYSISPIPV